MSAPSAPTIRVRQFGGFLRVAWRVVENATDYNIYLGDTTAPTGLEDQLSDSDEGPSGWMVWYSPIQIGKVFVRVTALNAQAEESAYSNECFRYMTSGWDNAQTPHEDTSSLNQTRRN